MMKEKNSLVKFLILFLSAKKRIVKAMNTISKVYMFSSKLSKMSTEIVNLLQPKKTLTKSSA
jgi:hypothetical protein